MTGTSPYLGAASSIKTGGTSVIAIYGPTQGGLIVNPSSTQDQGVMPLSTAYIVFPYWIGPFNTAQFNTLPWDGSKQVTTTVPVTTYGAPESLYVSLTGPAGLLGTNTTTELPPGYSMVIPPTTENVWVNAATSGHRFTSITLQPQTQFPPTPPVLGAFPPNEWTGLTQVIPSYLYQQYTDDDDLQAFVISQNQATQFYVDWFLGANLPVYQGLSGALLDWVADGLYGIVRPSLFSYKPDELGPFNTYMFNELAYNQVQLVGPVDLTITTDDIFKRIITWHVYKADGKYFTVNWLKRRIYRFLFGANGEDAVGPTYQISVTFGADNELTITLLKGVQHAVSGCWFDGYAFNEPFNAVLDSVQTTFSTYSPIPLAQTFAEAVNTGALEMPFQYNVIVNA